jgi:Fic family protein
LDLNFETLGIVTKCLRIKLDYTNTIEYIQDIDSKLTSDFRYLVDGKKDTSSFERYIQVFEDKHGFINNLSILDLLFNEGKFTVDYLKNQPLL